MLHDEQPVGFARWSRDGERVREDQIAEGVRGCVSELRWGLWHLQSRVRFALGQSRPVAVARTGNQHANRHRKSKVKYSHGSLNCQCFQDLSKAGSGLPSKARRE